MAHHPEEAETDGVEFARIPFSLRTLDVEPREVVERSDGESPAGNRPARRSRSKHIATTRVFDIAPGEP